LALTKRETDILKGFVTTLLGEMDLTQWSVLIEEEPLAADDDAVARIVPTYGQYRAVLFLCQGFTDAALSAQQRYLVHELTHLHLQAVYRSFTAAQQVVSPGEYAILDITMKEAMETATGAIATAWARALPGISYQAKEADQEPGSC
jgi:hypothetical protein